MRKKVQILTVVIVLGLASKYLFYRVKTPRNLPSSKKESLDTNTKKSISKKKQKTKPGKVKPSNKLKLKNINKKTIQRLRSEIDKIYLLPLKEASKKINRIKERLEIIQQWKLDNNIALSLYDMHKPQFILTMSILSKQKPQKLIGTKLIRTDFSMREMSLIKQFSESNDFINLANKGKLEKVVSMDYLLKKYSKRTDVYYNDKNYDEKPLTAPDEIPEDIIEME